MVQGGLTLRGEADSGSKEQVKIICRSKSKGIFPSGWSQTHEPTSIEFNILWNSSIANIISWVFILFDPNLPTLRLYISSISALLSHFYFVLLMPLLSHFLFSSSCSPFSHAWVITEITLYPYSQFLWALILHSSSTTCHSGLTELSLIILEQTSKECSPARQCGKLMYLCL